MDDTKSKVFHLGDVLSVTTGRLMSKRGIDGVYDILNFLTGDELFTHQLPRARQECLPYLLKQHPQLEGVEIGEVNASNFEQVLERLCAEYGESLMVSKIPVDAHEQIDPISEAAEKIHPNNIIVVQADNQ